MRFNDEAPKGSLWKDGYSPLKGNATFKTAKELHKACCRYFEWAEKNFYVEEQVSLGKNGLETRKAAKMRAFTIQGLCRFIGINYQSWQRYRKEEGYEHLAPVVEWADACIFEQKFTAAAVGLMSASFISRDLGLADKTEITGADGGPVKVEGAFTDDVKSSLDAIAAKLAGNFTTRSEGET